MNYRPEIDGLRAVAVLPVIFFHAGLAPFYGGYVGVDVFFVISGFLITGIISEDIKQKRFSLMKFYERRARRLFPAFAVVLLITTIGMLRLETPENLQAYAKSLSYVSVFAANIYFTFNLGYFNIGAEFQPLLHTWSLAVEEQFYLLFPLFLLGLAPLAMRARKVWIWAILIVSFIACLIELGGDEATFFMLHTRAWELLAGALCALAVERTQSKKRGVLALVGLGLILISIFAYRDHTPYPSHFTLLPVVGTVLLLRYAERGTIAFRLLAWRPLVLIGLTSYSAYLWHQPILVLKRPASRISRSTVKKSPRPENTMKHSLERRAFIG